MRWQNHYAITLGGFCGLIIGCGLLGFSLFDVHNINWLLQANNQDAVQHFVGWEFFRNEPWHFPWGAIKNYGAPLGTSIVYTDSIPLLALLFKTVSTFLPEHFQYFGIWLATCFFLQGYFAFALSTQLTPHRSLQIMISLFFICSPIFLNRIVEHQSLVAHWVLLAGILFYVKPYSNRTNYQWLFLVGVTVMIHAYLALMVLLLWIAYLIKQTLIEKNISLRTIIYHGAMMLFLIMLISFLCGYFVVSLSDGIETEGYTRNSMNLLSPFFPGQGSLLIGGHWSQMIPVHPSIFPEQLDEGFNYLGLGMVFLLLVAAYQFLATRRKYYNILAWAPLFGLSFLLVIYSLSNVVSVGSTTLLNYTLPRGYSTLTEIFRDSARFFWPVYYLIFFLVLGVVSQIKNQNWAKLALLVALLLQLGDLSGKLIQIHHTYATQPVKQHSFDSPFWQQAGKRYQHIVFVPHISRPQWRIQYFQEFIYYAAIHHMTINQGYFARENHTLTPSPLLSKANKFLDPHTLYVIIKPEILFLLRSKLTPEDKIERVGNYVIIAPGWGRF